MGRVKDWRMELEGLPAYGEGWSAAMRGAEHSAPMARCPYKSGDNREAWRIGWDDCVLEHTQQEPE